MQVEVNGVTYDTDEVKIVTAEKTLIVSDAGIDIGDNGDNLSDFSTVSFEEIENWL